MLTTLRADLAALPPAARALQSVRVCESVLEGFPENWEEELAGLATTLPRVSGGSRGSIGEREIPGDGKPRLSGRTGFLLEGLPAAGLALEGCRDFALAGSGPGVPADPHAKHFLEIADCEDFALDGLALQGGRNAIFLHRCRRFRISNVELSDLEGYGIILFDCEDFALENVAAERCLASAALCVGETRRGLIRGLTSRNGRGSYNWDAGLHFNNCTPQITAAEVPEQSHEARSILDKTKRPGFILVEDLRVEGHRAQGVYLEGAVACTFRRAAIFRNNKEGICFDWGTVLCTLEDSRIAENGERANLSAQEIEADFLHHFPMLADGSSSCKLPAVSFDNAAFNQVRRCRLTDNFGGAVKTVRASTGNRILDNWISGNSRGDNPHHRVTWLHNADLGDANGEFVEGQALLDLGPSYNSRVEGNRVMALSWRELWRGARRAVRHRLWNRGIAAWFRPA